MNGGITTQQGAVRVRGVRLADIKWRGSEWAVTTLGIERLDGTYSIRKRELADGFRQGETVETTWLVHMAHKSADMDDFTEAFRRALVIHNIGVDPGELGDALDRVREVIESNERFAARVAAYKAAKGPRHPDESQLFATAEEIEPEDD
jgi:hypothetical protein